MIELAVIAAAVALGFFIVLFKMGIKKVLAYDLYVDIALTVLLMLMFANTFSGMVVALMGGLVISIILLVLRKFIGYERYESYSTDDGHLKYGWIQYPGWFTS